MKVCRLAVAELADAAGDLVKRELRPVFQKDPAQLHDHRFLTGEGEERFLACLGVVLGDLCVPEQDDDLPDLVVRKVTEHRADRSQHFDVRSVEAVSFEFVDDQV